jgi:hypothetical protein
VIFMVNTVLLSLVYSGARGQTLMSRFGGARGVMREAPIQEGPRGQAQRPAPSRAGGAPTLPGTDLSDQGVPAAAPVAESAPAAASVPAPAAEPQP